MPVVESLALNERTFFQIRQRWLNSNLREIICSIHTAWMPNFEVMKSAIRSADYVVTSNSTDTSRFASFIRKRFLGTISAISL